MGRNLAMNMLALQSSAGGGEAVFAIDGDRTNTGWTHGSQLAHTCSYTSLTPPGTEALHWWMVDLESVAAVDGVRIWAAVNAGPGAAPAVANVWLTRAHAADGVAGLAESGGATKCNADGVPLYPASSPHVRCPGSVGRYVYVVSDGTQLGLCEVEVYGPTPACPDFCAAGAATQVCSKSFFR